MDITFFDRDVFNIVMAAVLGGILGVEREWRGKSAGFRTLMLVSMGSALFTEVSILTANQNNMSDATRIASNIVTGIGFLGAGLIFKSDKNVKGLTTATTVWVASAIGMAAGAGDYLLAVATTFIAWIILVVLHLVERRIERSTQVKEYRLICSEVVEVAEVFDGKFTLKEQRLEKLDNRPVINWMIRASAETHRRAVNKMLEDRRIICLNQ